MSFRSHTLITLVAFVLLPFGCHHQKKAAVKKKATITQTKKVTETPKTNPDTPRLTHAGVLHEKLGLSEKDIAKSKLLVFVDDWYGVPYKYGGCQKTGIDCSCFTNLLCEKVYNLKVARQAGDMYKESKKITEDELKEGDLVFFKIGGNSVSHVGVYLKSKMFVHSSTSKGVIINSMNEAYYRKYFHAGGRVRQL